MNLPKALRGHGRRVTDVIVIVSSVAICALALTGTPAVNHPANPAPPAGDRVLPISMIWGARPSRAVITAGPTGRIRETIELRWYLNGATHLRCRSVSFRLQPVSAVPGAKVRPIILLPHQHCRFWSGAAARLLKGGKYDEFVNDLAVGILVVNPPGRTAG